MERAAVLVFALDCAGKILDHVSGTLLLPVMNRITPAFAALDLTSWLRYPLIRVGEEPITVLAVTKVILWVGAVLGLNFLIQHLLLQRVLARTRLNRGLQFAISRIFGYLFVALGFYVALVVNGVDLSSLAVVAGALGLGLGFGLQNVVANFVAGIVLLAERPVSVGDRIEVSGVAGTVSKISLRATTVTTNDNIAIIVPNSELTSNPVTNWSHGGPRVRLRIPIGVAYGTDPELVKTTLLEVAAANPDVLKSPAPIVFFDSFGDNALNFQLGVWTETMTNAPRRFRSDLNFAIERALRERRIEVPFPQRVVHLRALPPADAGETEAPSAGRSSSV